MRGQATTTTRLQRGTELDVPNQAEAISYAHPYYWAPFVLMGNYQ